ncbi:MAG: glutamate cyclase domain-containing protein, partial [Lachnospiraceae bacterium]
KEYPVSVGRVIFTKDATQAKVQAQELLNSLPPKAVIAIEAPGANKKGIYHNARGKDLTALECKSDVLFRKCQERGIYNMAIGDLGNEIGMGAIGKHLAEYVPYMEENGCTCGCGGGSAAASAAQDIITATISHWGAEALIAATAWLLKRPELIHSREMEEDAIKAATAGGMVDMTGWLENSIDGVDMEFHVTMLEMMRHCVVSNLQQFAQNAEWFEKVLDKKFFQ